MNKKVLFVIDTLQLGGAEQSLLANTTRFTHTDSVICHIYKGDKLKSAFEERGKKVYSLDIGARYGFLSAYKKLKEIVKREKPDLIVAYLTRSELVSRLIGRFNHVPVVGTFVNDLYIASYNQHLSWKARQAVSFFKFLNRITAKDCIGFVANSQAIKDANARHLSIPPQKIKVIRRGRDSSSIKRRTAEKQPGTPARFLNVSRLFAVKGHATLILGFKDYLRSDPDASLTIVGDGPLRDELKKLAADNGMADNVIFLGARNDVPDLLANYDCFVFPSIMEGFSGAIVEAMFAGIPVLATGIPQNLEAITHMQTGYIFDTESPAEVTRAMLWYKSNTGEAEKMAKNAYAFARDNFELNNIVAQFEEYLHTQIGAGK
jgi:glycosyltransferase involved in cell wall biosynthesis